MRSESEPWFTQQLRESLLQPPELGGVLLVGIVDVDEFAGRVDIVARVDAHGLHHRCGGVGHGGIEVDVGHERHTDVLRPEAIVDLAEALHLP